MRKILALVGMAVLTGALGCGGGKAEIKADGGDAGKKLDAASQADVMKQAIEKAPPEMRAKMEQQMEFMKKMQEGNPAARGGK